MKRNDLRAGKSTPTYVEKILAIHGNNPHGEPKYRLIWSERKQIFFMGEWGEEYLYLPHPCWVLEKWLDPRKDAGPEAQWNSFQEFFLGPYPRNGTFMYAQHFPEDWHPSEESVRLLSKGLEESEHVPMKERERAIRENLQAISAEERKAVVSEIEESQDSASAGAAVGRVQQPVSGGNNKFRTIDDFERDLARAPQPKDAPRRGGKLIQ